MDYFGIILRAVGINPMIVVEFTGEISLENSSEATLLITTPGDPLLSAHQPEVPAVDSGGHKISA
jgi:hypothetical protein